MNLRHGRHHRQHIYEVSLAGPPEDDRLVGTLQTIEDAERIVEAVNRVAELEADRTELLILAQTDCRGGWLEATNNMAEDRLVAEGVLERSDSPMPKVRRVRFKIATDERDLADKVAELEAEVARLKGHAEAMAEAESFWAELASGDWAFFEHSHFAASRDALAAYRRDYPGGDHEQT